MTKREAKKKVINYIQHVLRHHLETQAFGITRDKEGVLYGDKDMARVREAVMEYVNAETIIAKKSLL